MFKIVLISIATLFCLNLEAKTIDYHKYDKFFYQSAKKYNIPYLVLKTVAMTENIFFNHDIIKYNKNGTIDIGLMQINTIQIEELSELKLTKDKLMDIEVNIDTAAYIISKLIISRGYSWKAIGVYHSKTKKHKNKWIKRAKENIQILSKKEIRKLNENKKSH